jgi:uncharacterized repeat protein (TIGR01451 family)
MIEKIIKTGLVAFVMLCLVQTASASGLFYSGDIIIDSITANAEIDTNATVIVEYTLINEGDKEETVDLAFSQFPVQLWIGDEKLENPVMFKPKEEKMITLGYVTTVGGNTTKVFSFNPTLTFNGKANSKRVRSFSVGILLPDGIKKIIGANKEYCSKEIGGKGRVLYKWVNNDIYLTTLTVRWSVLDIDLSVEKKASPQKITAPNQTITVEIALENMGDKEVNNIILTDDYVPSDFEAVEPLEEFTIPKVNASDPRLFWIKRIGKLQPGEIRAISYSVRYIGDVSQIYDFDLKPSTVIVNGHLVAVSNEVTISKMVGATLVEEAPEVPEKTKGFTTQYLVIGTIIAIIILLAGAYLLRRRKKEK